MFAWDAERGIETTNLRIVMAQATHAAFDTQHGIGVRSMPDRSRVSAAVAKNDVILSVHNDFCAVEQEWRAFERYADCTVFQAFDWMAAWHRNIGVRKNTTPVIVAGRDAAGQLLFILPLAIEGGVVRRLTWFASELCDYNTPLLAPDFSRRIDPARFLDLWRDIVGRLQSHPALRYDLVHFEKMPEKVGGQDNPMLVFPAAAHPSGAHLTHLSGDWEAFYASKRSSSTRRGDRTKRRRLAESGEVRFADPKSAVEAVSNLEILMQQKSRQFAKMGVADLFARPGYAEFYRDVTAAAPDLVHVSRLDVGSTAAAVNLGLMFRGSYHHVLASYDLGPLSKFGPGAAHLHELMRYAIERGCKVFDFTIGDERYKHDWSDTELKLYDHMAIATTRGAIVAGPLIAARMVKRWIKQTPAVWNAFTRARAFIGALRGKPAG